MTNVLGKIRCRVRLRAKIPIADFVFRTMSNILDPSLEWGQSGYMYSLWGGAVNMNQNRSVSLAEYFNLMSVSRSHGVGQP